MIGIFFIEFKKSSAQVYGLRFQSHDVILDKRTELDLSPDDFLKFHDDFEIFFDYKLERGLNNSVFGYVFRIISRDGYNIDLISTASPSARLNLIIGKTNTIIPIQISDNEMKKWISFRIKLFLRDDKIVFFTPDTFYTQKNAGIKNQKSYKIIFGSNDLQNFKTTDVPPMEIKEIRINERGKLKLYWPLDEEKGNFAYDHIKNKKALVKNPIWMRSLHKHWHKELEKELDEVALVTADPQNDRIFIVGKENMYIFYAGKNSLQKITYKNRPLFLTSKYKVTFNNLDDKIYCYLVNEEKFYVLNVETGEWNESGEYRDYRNKYLHHNNFYSASNNSIYIFGGYGRLKYNNEIKKIDLNNQEWCSLPSNDSVFPPRYLAGLGYLNDTLYILGGYGSLSGDQLINPHSYYDLLGYSLVDEKLFHKFEIPRIMDNMCIANSMWIDSKSRNFYALGFEKSVFNGYLQLIKGNLDTATISKVGNKIPYQFLDIRSFAELYYVKHQEKLFAYTSYITDSSTTKIGIYSINFPPNINEEDLVNDDKKHTILIFAVLSSILISLLFIYRLRKGKVIKVSEIIGNSGALHSELELGVTYQKSDLHKPKFQIIFFGGFQIFNKDFNDITNKFSPLLKELFLLILLHSIKNEKGISSKMLTEILWFDKSEKSARNNRAVNIAKLRNILEEMGNCTLTKSTGYWKIVFKKLELKNDYVNFLELINSGTELTEEKISYILEITREGPFLQNISYDWLDDFKSEVSDLIVDTFITYAKFLDIRNNAHFIIQLADNIFIFDSVNEEAMAMKCRSLYFLGKHSLSKITYDSFVKEYRILYNQEFDYTFSDIVKNNYRK